MINDQDPDAAAPGETCPPDERVGDRIAPDYPGSDYAAAPGGMNPFSSVHPTGFMSFPHLERRAAQVADTDTPAGTPLVPESREYEYPYGPGYAPLPRDGGYPADPGYAAGYGSDPRYGAWPHPRAVAPTPLAPRPEAQANSAPPAGPRAGAEPQPGLEPGFQTSDSLTVEFLLRGTRPVPGSGWRHVVYRATGGLFRIGESAADMRRRDLVNRVKTPVAGGHHRVAVLSLKGGVGKTTTVVGLGATLATFRGDRVIAVDANPDRGTLSDKVRLETAATVRDLLNERSQVHRYADVRAFTSQASSRLEVLASDRDPAVSTAFNAEDYSDAARVLEHFYSICITDCGTGLLHSAMAGVLRLADQIVLVSSPSVDGARSASATLDWLDAHEYGDLVRNGVVVLSAIRPRSKSTVDLDRLEQHFAARCRAVTRIPYDSHLEEGAEVELELLATATAEAYLELAAIVGDGFAWPRRIVSQPTLPLPYSGSRSGIRLADPRTRRARLVADGGSLENC